MMSKSNFDWDDKLHKVTAPEELWSEYLKDYPRVKMYRTKMVPFFSSLPIVLADDKANGRYGAPIDDIGCDSEGDDDYDFDESIASMHGDEKKRSRMGEAIAASLSKIAVVFDNAMEQMTKKRQRVINN
ncbi:hypothetical protein AMTRI_Chr11g96630 [Amborella trichopoda]